MPSLTQEQREAEEAVAKELGFKLHNSTKDGGGIVWYRKTKLNEREATYEEVILWRAILCREQKLRAYERAVEEIEVLRAKREGQKPSDIRTLVLSTYDICLSIIRKELEKP